VQDEKTPRVATAAHSLDGHRLPTSHPKGRHSSSLKRLDSLTYELPLVAPVGSSRDHGEAVMDIARSYNLHHCTIFRLVAREQPLTLRQCDGELHTTFGPLDEAWHRECAK
jgi:hypothetical protein